MFWSAETHLKARFKPVHRIMQPSERTVVFESACLSLRHISYNCLINHRIAKQQWASQSKIFPSVWTLHILHVLGLLVSHELSLWCVSVSHFFVSWCLWICLVLGSNCNPLTTPLSPMFSHPYSDNSMWILRKIFSNNQITFPLLELALEILVYMCDIKHDSVTF